MNETMANNMENWIEMLDSFAEQNGGFVAKEPGRHYSAIILPKTFPDPIKSINNLLQENGICMVRAVFIGYINDPSENVSRRTVFFKLLPND
jgi:hypothetical protein